MTKNPNCKIVLLGKESTGKSCLVRRFTDNEFDTSGFASTVGASYAAKKVVTSCGEIVISVWDTAGQERFDSLTKLYYNGASAALICIDLTDGSSFSKAQYWVKELKKHQPNCSCYIVLTKSDLLDAPPKIGSLTENQPKEEEVLLASLPEQEAPQSLHDAEELSSSPADALHESNEVALPEKKPCDSPVSPFDRQSSSENTDRSSHTDGLASSWQSGSSKQSTLAAPVRRKEVADSQINALAQSTGAQILRTSSATGEGVKELFQGVAEDLAPSITKACLEEDQFLQELQLRTPVSGPAPQEAAVSAASNTQAGLPRSKVKSTGCCS